MGCHDGLQASGTAGCRDLLSLCISYGPTITVLRFVSPWTLQLILNVLDDVGVRTLRKPVKLLSPKPRTLSLHRAGLVLNHEKESCLLLQNRKKKPTACSFQYRSLY